MKIVLWISFGVIIVVGLVIGAGFWMFHKETKEVNPEYIVQFLKDNATNKNVSLSINHNNEKWLALNAEEPLPLASTVKIIVAIEFARQAADGRIDPEKKVKLKELENYYVPKTDGGAHEAWIESLTKHKQMDSVSLNEIAKGMIAFSSNANTDYLIDVLGLENINQVRKDLHLTDHEPMYPIVSALFIPMEIMNEKNLTKQETFKALKEMDMAEYRKHAIQIHNRWLTKPPTESEKSQLVKMMDMDFQKIWSDRLPRATTKDYVSIMEKLNQKSFFDKQVYKHLDPIMEQLMNNPKNREWLKHAGQKGGSTAFILTVSMYATDQKGNQTELAFFANDLSLVEQQKLSRNMNSFQLKFLKEPEFRQYVKQELAGIQ